VIAVASSAAVPALHAVLADATPSYDRWSFIIAAWAISAVVLGAWVIMILRQARAIAPEVPPAERRWMTSTDSADPVVSSEASALGSDDVERTSDG